MSAYRIEQIEVKDTFEQNPDEWLLGKARAYDLRILLAHADDGVIWGRANDDGLHTSHGIAPESPPLRATTLQQCRLFGPAGELLVWRINDGWRARYVTDTTDHSDDTIDEDQILWGSNVETVKDRFTLVREGSQGMRHAVPIVVSNQQLERHQLRLRVRHYINENIDGEARVTLSRLVRLLPEND